MDQLLLAIDRLGVHQRICWRRPRHESTLVFERVAELLAVIRRLMAEARELEVHRAGENRYVVYVRD